jgi:hypothetical protein
MLLAFARKLRATVAPDNHTLDVPTTLTVIEAYPQLRYGEIEGIGTVTIDATGNMVGFSPVERCKDAQGEIAWIPTELVTNLRLEPFGVVGTGTPSIVGTTTTR